MNRIKAGIVGYGGMGEWHANTIKDIDEIELCGIFDIKAERMQAASSQGIHVYNSYEEMLSDEAIQLIVVATPNDSHKALAIMAMEAGKNMVCEKPVAMNSSELKEMIEASNRCSVVFTVHQNRRWDKDYRIIKKLFDEVQLGRVFCIESRVHGSRGIPGDWRNKKQHGGGMVLDWGVHLIDQMFQIVGSRKVESIYATLSYVTNEECDDGFKIIVQFQEGLQFHLEVGTSNFIDMPRWYILGENGSAVINDWNCDGRIVKVFDWEKRDAVPVVTAAGLTKTMAPRTSETIRTYPLPEVDSDIKDFYRNVCKAINHEEEQLIKHEELMRSMRFMEAVFLAAETNSVITNFEI